MRIESKRVGSVEVNDDKIITFKGGLLGFPELTKFFIADDPNDTAMPFKWLVSIDDPEMAFLVTDPGLFFKDYAFDLTEEDRQSLNAEQAEDLSVIVLLTVPSDPKQITANLRGPLIIHWRSMVGRQIVLKDVPYQTKHFIFVQETSGAETSDTSTSHSTTETNLPLTSSESDDAKTAAAQGVGG